MKLEPEVGKGHAIRFAYMAVSGLLFLGANAAWNGIGYLNPLAWFLEWSAVVLAFLCVYSAVRTRETSSPLYGYILILISLIISGVSYYISVVAPDVQANIYASVNPLSFIVLAIPLAILMLVILQYMGKLKNGKFLPLLFFLSVIGAMGYLLYSFYSISPAFPTDESVFDMYGAHLFLSGMNPYDPSLMSNSFSFYNFQFGAFDPITPLTTGGYVQSLTYPALSFLVFIPAVILNLKASIIMLPVLLVPIVIVWYRAWSRGDRYGASFSLLPFIGLLLYTYQGGSADTDALWASLLMLSYMALPKQKTSGLLYGLSLSVKQLPFIIAPFLLYYMYREYGVRKTIMWSLIGAGTFFLINGYFIIQNPGYWLSSMLANEFAPLIGIGFGIPQISFAGIFQIPRIYFSIIMVDLLLVFLALFIIKYGQLKYTIFAFPIIIFLLNYRLFPQYLYYWMIVSLVPMLDAMHDSKSTESESQVTKPLLKKSRIIQKPALAAFLVSIILFGSIGLGYHDTTQHSSGSFDIESVTISGINSTGYVNQLTLNISFLGSPGTPITKVFFRIFSNGPIINGNMLQWTTNEKIIMYSGQTYSLTVIPEYPAYAVNPINGFLIVVYYGSAQGSYYEI